MVDRSAIEAALGEAETALETSGTLRATGFWQVVAAVKADPELVKDYGRRISEIDARAFREWAWIIVPLRWGNLIMTLVTLVGLGLIWWAYPLTGLSSAVAFLVGVGVLMVTTHGLAHLAVGSVAGIRFTAWFIAGLLTPQPGVKTDYESYLRAPATSRAWMHASGAIMTKIVPFALIGAAVASGVPRWVVWVLLGVGVVTIVTDVVWSTTASDWKRFRREMRFAQRP